MEVPDVEGIRLSLLDPESRLRRMDEGPPSQAYPRIERMWIRGTDFFEDTEVPFSPCLTTIIGGRGTGKSTVVEYLRHMLDQAKTEDFEGEEAEIRENVQSLLRTKDELDHGETEGTLLPDHEIEMDVVVAGRRYRVRKTRDGEEVERNPDTADAEVVEQFEIRTLLQPRVLSQHQIARIAKDPASQRNELDALVDREDLAEVLRQRRIAIERIEGLQTDRVRFESRLRELPAKETELQRVRDQIDFIETGGGRAVLARFREFELERDWLDLTVRGLETRATGLEEQSAATREPVERWPSPPEDGPSQDWIDAVAERVEARISRTVTTLTDEAAELRALTVALEEERSDRWLPGYDGAREAYEELRTEMEERGVDFAQHERLLQHRSVLEREVAEIRAIGGKLDSLADALRAARSELVQVHERRLSLRRDQTRALEELDADAVIVNIVVA